MKVTHIYFCPKCCDKYEVHEIMMVMLTTKASNDKVCCICGNKIKPKSTQDKK